MCNFNINLVQAPVMEIGTYIFNPGGCVKRHDHDQVGINERRI